MTKLILIRGYPGSGKTTIGKQLAEEGVGKFVDHNAILTFIANIAGNDDGIYDDIASLELAITRKLLKGHANVIVARGFTSLESLKPYENVAIELGVELIIVRLEVDQDTLSKRVSSRERLVDFNPTVSEKALSEWVKGNPITNHLSEETFDNTKPMAEVVEAIISIV
jgi:adenylate kinase family enzyme